MDKIKTIRIKYETWDKLWDIKRSLEKRGNKIKSLNQIIDISIGIFEIVDVVCEEYSLDHISATTDAMKLYTKYLEKRWNNGQKRGF